MDITYGTGGTQFQQQVTANSNIQCNDHTASAITNVHTASAITNQSDRLLEQAFSVFVNTKLNETIDSQCYNLIHCIR